MLESYQSELIHPPQVFHCNIKYGRIKGTHNHTSKLCVLPALSSPGTVRCDDHLSTVVCVCVVHIELQALPLVALYQREKVLRLQRFRERWTETGDTQSASLPGEATAARSHSVPTYLIHNRVRSDDVVCVRPQASKGRW